MALTLGGDRLNRAALGKTNAKSGPTASRPTNLDAQEDVGYEWFDTTLGLPVFWTGTAWHNAAGTVA